MVNAQEWLDKKYPKEQRTRIRELDIRCQDLEGSLKLEGFINLEELNCYNNPISNLDLSNCCNLREIECGWNYLLDLNLNNCFNIVKLNCNSNYLTSLKFLSELDSKKLEELDIKDNCFPLSDLTSFGRFINLKSLELGNYNIKVSTPHIRNHFAGSLEPLQSLTKLEVLNIGNTDVNFELEYLPNSVKGFYFNEEKLNYKSRAIEQELRKFGEPKKEKWMGKYGREYNFSNLLELWKKTNLHELKSVGQMETQLEIINDSPAKKSKNAKQKAKLSFAQGHIQQLQTELETEKTKNVNLKKEHSFYKRFFDNYFQNKKTEIDKLKSNLNKEELEWLDIYCEASQETKKTSFVKKQLKRAKENLKVKLSEEELKLILNKQAEITELESQLNNLQIQEAQIEIPPKQN